MRHFKSGKVKYIISLLGGLFFSNAFADQAPPSYFPEIPGISLTGLYGNVSSGFGDALIPIMGKADTGFIFLDSQGLFQSHDQYSMSLGSGYRTLQNQWGILSAYVFADVNSSEDHHFWFLSPGIQRLGDNFDLSANLYIPVSQKKFNTGRTFADNIGVNNWVSFSGHDQIDQYVNTFESTGIGGDVEAGMRLPYLKNNTKIYIGGYYFAPQDNDSILGGTARMNVPVNRFFTITGSESYDNVMHNTIKVGLTVSLGGRSSGSDYSGDLRERMVDSVQRNLVAVAGGAHTMEPVESGYETTGDYAVERSNIWFFSQNGAGMNAATCTADSPCAFTQDNINSVNLEAPNANLYVSSGQYSLTGTASPLILNAGQALFGRDSQYTGAASSNSLPTLLGALELTGNNYVERIKLLNDGSQAVGISLDDNAQNVILNNIVVGDKGDNPLNTYQTGIQLGNNDALDIRNSVVNAFGASNNITDIISGVKINDGSGDILKISDSTINVSSAQSSDLAGVFVGNDQTTGGNAQNNNVTLSGDQITVRDAMDAKETFGVFLGNYFTDNSSLVANNQLTVLNSNINVDSRGICSAFGLFIGNFEHMAPPINNNSVTMKDSTVIVNSDKGNAYGVFEGMFNGDNSLAVNNNLLITDSKIQATADEYNAYGLDLSGDNSTFTLKNNVITANAQNDIDMRRYAYGVDLEGGGDILNLSDNRIVSTGSGSNVLVVGLEEESPNPELTNVINAVGDSIFASSADDNAHVNGVLIENQGATVNLSNEQIVARAGGRNATAAGLNVAGDNNVIDVTNSHIQAIATGVDSIAMGIAANSDSIYASASNNTITLAGDNINAVSLFGSAFGLADSLQGANNNIWTINSNTTVNSSSLFKQCSTYFNGTCVP